MYVLETKQVSQIDSYLVDHNYYSILELISMAGNAFYSEVKKYHRPLILAGFGNNGADALKVAQLYMEDRFMPSVYAYKKELMNGICRYLSEGIHFIDTIENIYQYDVIIDGLFGAGLNRPIEEDLAKIIEMVNQVNIPRISIDIPSGINGDGMIYDHYFQCDQVITFMGLKKLYLIEDLKPYYHQVILKPLGIQDDTFIKNRIAYLIDENYAIEHLKTRKYNDYKNKNGVTLHLTGSRNYTGAAIMAAQGALYSGGGIVKVMSTPAVIRAMQISLPEVVCIERNESFEIKEQAVLLGSGLGQSQDSIHLVKYVLENCKVPLVIDADGINILANHLDYLKNAKCEVVLTPHLGEYKRLDPQGDIDQFVKEYHCTVILKGPNTKICTPDYVYINSTGNKAMATGGSGDTLAGILVSLLGQGYEMNVACNLAVYIHGLAGDELAKTYYNVLPTKLSEQVGIVMRNLEKSKEKTK